MVIKINGLKWVVTNEAANSPDLVSSKGNPCFGCTHYFKQKIVMRGDMSPELYRQTIIHELLHAYTFSFGVHLFADEDTEEPIADFIGSHLDGIYHHANLIMDKIYRKG